MSRDFYSKLETLLKKDFRFMDQEGDLLKSNVIDCAYKADKKLIELLLENKEVKSKFFSKIKDIQVFNIDNFVAYIQDKNFLADSYTKYRNKIGLNIDGKFLNERKEVALVWPFKDCVLEGGMTKEDEKRKEIFFNEILAQDEIDKLLAPKVLTNWKRYGCAGEVQNVGVQDFEPLRVGKIKRAENGTIEENLIIKGNNLLALHCLKQQFQNKIKLIYIDPPYNTGNDSFGYNDNFNHSAWLTFMKNRLEMARDLLREDGVIFISCDDNEQAYLKVLCDEVFGRENFIGQFIWHKKLTGGYDNKYLNTQHEYITFYAKNENNLKIILEKKESKYTLVDECGEKYKWDSLWNIGGLTYSSSLDYAITAPDGTEIWPLGEKGKAFWLWSKSKVENERDKLKFTKDKKTGKWKVYKRIYASNGIIPGSMLDKDIVKGNTNSSSEIKKIFDGNKPFDYAKPSTLLKYLFARILKNSDTVLDFFAGSGTTAQAVLELNKEDGGNRKFILVEQLDYVEKITVERVKKVMQNLAKDKNLFSEKEKLDFIYCELMEYNERFVEKIKKADTTQKLLNIWKEMKTKSFLNYNVDIKKFDETIDEFKKFAIPKQKRILFDFLNKNQLYVNLSEIEDKEFGVEERDKKLNGEFYE